MARSPLIPHSRTPLDAPVTTTSEVTIWDYLSEGSKLGEPNLEGIPVSQQQYVRRHGQPLRLEILDIVRVGVKFNTFDLIDETLTLAGRSEQGQLQILRPVLKWMVLRGECIKVWRGYMLPTVDGQARE